MSDHIGPKLLAVICLVVGVLTASRAGTETGAPVAGQSTLPGSTPTDTVETTKGVDCSTARKPASAGGASVVPATGESLQHKRWQPTGGEIQFTVKSFVAIPADASVIVCFRWKTDAESQRAFIPTRPSRLELEGDGKVLKVTTTVPQLGPQPNDVKKALPLVPLAEVRILAIKEKVTAADLTTAIGITHPVAAFAFAIITVGLGLLVLHIAARWRLKDYSGIQKANWFLRIISTPSGFASLSQLQIVLWTFVVAASAVYVMSLSGQLIDITTGTLVLLGIAGAAGIGAKAHSEAQGATAEAKATKAAADKGAAEIDAAKKAGEATTAAAGSEAAVASRQAADAAKAAAVIADATKVKADAIKNPPATQVPQWSDLIVNESVKDDGTKTREIDVARFQMLLFTLVTAVFVLMTVVTTYVIPEISVGFQTLMGISNGVYLGSKIAQG